MKAKLLIQQYIGMGSVRITIEGPPEKVDELVRVIREAVKKWEYWEEE
jgi:hypothetical protein